MSTVSRSDLHVCVQVVIQYVSLEHKTSLKSLGYICSNNQQYIVWVKIIDFYFMPKIIRILRSCSMKIFSKFPTINILKLNFWLVICIAKNFIWTTLKVIFSIFRFFAPSDSRFTNSCISVKYCLNFWILTLMTGFVVQGHIYICSRIIAFMNNITTS